MKRLFATTVLTSFLAVPAAFAQDEQMTCAEFNGLDAAAQAEALVSLEGGMGMGADGAATDTTGATDETAGDAASGDAAAGAGAAADTGAAGDAGAATDTGATTGGASDTGADAAADTDAGAAGAASDMTAEAVAQACTDNPDLSVQEAMEQAQAN